MGPEEIVNATVSMIQQFNNWKQLRKDIDAVIRLLYLESMRNVNLLESLDFEKRNIKTDDDGFKKISLMLETDVLDLLFLEGRKSSKLFRIMEKMSDLELEEEDDFTAGNGRHTLNALSFIYIKIWTLKKLIVLDTKGRALKNIRYRSRIKNILSAYDIVLKNLREMDEIKPLLQRKL